MAETLTVENLLPTAVQGPAFAFNRMVNERIGWLASDPVASNALRLVLVMYAGMAAPRLHPAIDRLFSHPAFRVLVLSLVLWTANRDPSLSLVLAMVFVVSMNTLSGRGMFETFFAKMRGKKRRY
jgi:hypothetical protein